MVSAVLVVYQSENPCYHHRLPFPFDAKLKTMNAFGWARDSDCKIVLFGLLALARGGRASHFLVEPRIKKRRKSSGGTLGGGVGS